MTKKTATREKKPRKPKSPSSRPRKQLRDSLDLRAIEVGDVRDMEIAPGTVSRKWMDSTGDRFAYRCLPLLIANQAGWVIACPTSFSAVWNGGQRLEDVSLDFAGLPSDPRISSHFGSGIVTFRIPYLFRTPRGYALWVRGPANVPKDGAFPLEGIVETDWSAATFTMNWKLTRPKTRVSFTKGEPFCMVTPISLELLERMVPAYVQPSAEPETLAAYQAWSQKREAFNTGLARREPATVERRWQKDYFLGKADVPDSTEIEIEHRTKLELRAFSRRVPEPSGDS